MATTIPYDEAKSIEFGQGINDANADYKKIHKIDIPYDPGMICVMAQRADWDYYFGGLTWEDSKIKHLNEYRDVYQLPHVGPIPPPPVGVLPFPPPTREQVCRVRVGFQGASVTLPAYGTFPCFGPETTTMTDEELNSYCKQLADQGWTHGEIAVSWQYAEPGFMMPIPGRDLTHDLDELARRQVIMLKYFKSVVVFLAGDGLSKPKNPDGSYPYNDPVGHTYGHEWLMDNLPRIISHQMRFKAGDLTQYCLYLPGYDGVFYGWGRDGEVPDGQPDRVVNFGKLFRSICPNGYLGIEHTPGHYPVGEGGSDWETNGRMANFDVILSEYNSWPEVSGDYWQIVARSLQTYHMPPDQAQAIANGPSDPRYAAANDPAANPSTHAAYWYLSHGSPRGPYFYVPYEYATYPWTRNRISKADVEAGRKYFYDMGCADVC